VEKNIYTYIHIQGQSIVQTFYIPVYTCIYIHLAELIEVRIHKTFHKCKCSALVKECYIYIVTLKSACELIQ